MVFIRFESNVVVVGSSGKVGFVISKAGMLSLIASKGVGRVAKYQMIMARGK
jgi:hypothetical protein